MQIANLADDLAETPTRENLVKFMLVFTPAWYLGPLLAMAGVNL